MIQLDHIVKTFDTGADKVHAVSDVTLHIKSGEIFGIIGFSGAGKSTLVRCINLLERPTSGTVTVDGKVLTDLPALQADAFQNRRRERRLPVKGKRTYKTADQGESQGAPGAC